MFEAFPTFIFVRVSMFVKSIMKVCSRFFLGLAVVFVSACSMDADPEGLLISSYNFDFNESDFDWQYGFSDYPPGANDSGFYELQFAYAEEVSATVPKKALMISGNNHSDDLFMYVKKRIDGLAPNTDYTVTFQVEFASDAEMGSVGVGGSPGESVFLKAGATDSEPKSVVEGDRVVMNIDKGNQAEDGEDMIVIGNIAVPENSDGFVVAVRSNGPTSSNSFADKPFVARTNSMGQLWLIVGTDSGFEGVTTLYYTKISAVFSN
jgi:hypothetical protein